MDGRRHTGRGPRDASVRDGFQPVTPAASSERLFGLRLPDPVEPLGRWESMVITELCDAERASNFGEEWRSTHGGSVIGTLVTGRYAAMRKIEPRGERLR